MERRLTGLWLGRRGYAPVHDLMQRLVTARQAGLVDDVVLLLEHEPVVTLGRGASWEHVLLPREALAARGVALEETGRGGDVTLHAPGQLVAYPIVSLAPDRCDVRRYVGDLRAAMAELCAARGVEGGEVPGQIGLWVDADSPARWPGAERARALAKVGAIGVRISRWVTQHGFALNLDVDLSLFSLIVPCGISEHGVTSVARLTGRAPTPAALAGEALAVLARRLDRTAAPLIDAAGVALAELAFPGPDGPRLLPIDPDAAGALAAADPRTPATAAPGGRLDRPGDPA